MAISTGLVPRLARQCGNYGNDVSLACLPWGMSDGLVAGIKTA